MENTGTWEMPPHEAFHPSPGPAATTALTPSTKGTQPVTNHLLNETFQLPHVAGDGVIVQPSLNNTSQPASRFAGGPVHSFTKFYVDLVESSTHAFAHAVAMEHEPAVRSGLGAHVCEPKEIERFRTALSTPFSICGRVNGRTRSDVSCLRGA